jgi:CubicO group peptidase (beta-lactamase class C family)
VTRANAAGLARLHQEADRVFADMAPHRPGCAAGVMQNGRILWTRGFGCADLDTGRPITPDTVFNIASISKQITAFAVLLLAQEGRLSLDDPARFYVPELGSYAAPVTIRILLHHTGGLADYMDSAEAAGIGPEQKLTAAQVLAFTGAMTAAERPAGVAYDYSNTGYYLLSLIVERVSGRSMKAFAEDRIMRPLGMNRSTIVDAYPAGIAELARGYAPADTGYRIDESLWENSGDGQVHTTIGDLLLWARNLETGAVGGIALARQMREAGTLADGTILDYAAGLEIDAYRGTRTIGHGGSWAGYNGDLLWLPERRLIVAILYNFEDPNMRDRTRALIDLFWDAPVPEGERSL